MSYLVEVSDEFRDWYEPLTEAEQDSIGRVVGLLEERGPALPFPFSSAIQSSALTHMRELRIQHEGRPYRVLYAFDQKSVLPICCWVGTKRATVAGTQGMYPKPKESMPHT